MLKYERRLIGLLLPVALLVFAADVSAQRVRRDIYEFTPPNLTVVAEPAVVTALCPSEGPAAPVVVQLTSRATSNDPIRYRWSSSVGRIDGSGATVTWDLTGVAPGYYRANLDIDTGSGDAACQAFSSVAVRVNPCVPPRPVCPTVNIICPERPVLGEPLTFRSNVSPTPGVSPIYNWTVSGGQIISGQGTPAITVDTTGLAAGQSITAKLSMGGFVEDCSATCTVNFPPPPPVCRKFDEYPNISYNDEKARLDNYGIALQGDPTSTGYVIVYPGVRGRPADIQRQTRRAVDYLVNARGIASQRIVTLVGPTRDVLMVELWVCPQGAAPPVP